MVSIWPLLHPQQVADAADLHVAHGQLVAAAELGEFLDRPQPLPRRIAERGITGIEQPGVGLDAAAADPTAQLIQLGQAELLGVLDQDRVDARDIEATLHDRGAEHQIGLAGVERHHRVLQFALGHLAVGHQQFQTRDHQPQPLGHLLDPLHPRHHVEDLAAAIELLADGAAHRLLIEGGQVGLDRPAQWRRRGDQAHLAYT